MKNLRDVSVTVVQLGARMHYAVPRIFHRAGMIERLFTNICVVKGWSRIAVLVSPPLSPPWRGCSAGG